MGTGEDPEVHRQRVLARRSTVAGVAGIALIGIAIVLTLTRVGGDVLPTVLAIVGVGSLVAAVSTGAMQIVDRYRRSDSDFDD